MVVLSSREELAGNGTCELSYFADESYFARRPNALGDDGAEKYATDHCTYDHDNRHQDIAQYALFGAPRFLIIHCNNQPAAVIRGGQKVMLISLSFQISCAQDAPVLANATAMAVAPEAIVAAIRPARIHRRNCRSGPDRTTRAIGRMSEASNQGTADNAAGA